MRFIRPAAAALAAIAAFLLLLSSAPLAAASSGAPGTEPSRTSTAAATAPVTITGTISWKASFQYSDGSGGFTQKGIFKIDAVSTAPPPYGQMWHNVGSSYSVTDDYKVTSGAGSSCPATTTGNTSASGPLLDPGSSGNKMLVNFGPPYFQWVGFEFTIGANEDQTTTDCHGSTTQTVGRVFLPQCWNTIPQSHLPGLTGQLPGTSETGTLPIDCSGTYPSGDASITYSATGTLTVGSGPQLAITGPPNGSTVAVTDKNYFTPQPGPSERAPKTRQLIVTGTTGCPQVTVNGVTAVVSGQNWHVNLPAKPLGQLTLTAKAPGCGQVSSTVTMISLDITSPAENASEPITAQPAMPALNATINVTGYSADTSAVPFDWTLAAFGNTVSRAGTPGHWTSDWAGYDQTAATGSTTGTGQPWKPSYDHVVGGIANLTVTASLPGVLDNPVTSDPRWFAVPGTNPPAATAKSFVDQADPQYSDTIRHIICVESNWRQFKAQADSREPAIPGVPADWTPNPGPRQPLFGPPAGIGISQLDPAILQSPDQYWNWQANLQGGIAVFHDKLNQARKLAASEQARLAGRLHKALAAANQKRHAQGLPPLHMTAITVPQLTDQQILLQTIRLYNGGNEFHFDADYVLSPNNLNVNLVGTKAWVEPPAGHWGKAPADLHLRQPWIALAPQYQGYVTSVLHCQNS
jgi:hypothetical protein